MNNNKNCFFRVGIDRRKDEVLLKSFNDYNHIDLKLGDLTLESPFKMRVSEGTKFYDVLGFQDTSNFAISHKFYSILRDNNVSGVKFYEILIENIDEKYYGLQIIGRCGKLLEPHEVGFYKGLKFNINTWDKSDIFSPEETVLFFCNEKVKNILKENKITNVDIEDISQIQGYSFG